MKTDLPTRLEGAAAGSRELDGAIHRLFFPEDLIMTDVGSVGPITRPCKREPLGDVPHLGDLLIAEMIGVSGYSTSIDAAVALAERALGECRIVIERYSDGSGWAMIKSSPITPSAEAATPALALCAAVVRAHAEQVQG